MKLSRVLIFLVLFGMALVPAQAVTTVLSGVLTPEEAGFGWRSGAGTFQLELTGSRLNYFVSSHYVNSAEPTEVAMLGINLPTGRLDLAFTAHGRGWGTGCFFSAFTLRFHILSRTTPMNFPSSGFLNTIVTTFLTSASSGAPSS